MKNRWIGDDLFTVLCFACVFVCNIIWKNSVCVSVLNANIFYENWWHQIIDLIFNIEIVWCYNTINSLWKRYPPNVNKRLKFANHADRKNGRMCQWMCWLCEYVCWVRMRSPSNQTTSPPPSPQTNERIKANERNSVESQENDRNWSGSSKENYSPPSVVE